MDGSVFAADSLSTSSISQQPRTRTRHVRDRTSLGVNDRRPLPQRTRRVTAAVAATLSIFAIGSTCDQGSTKPPGTCSVAREYAERHIVHWPEPIAQPILDRLLAGDAPAVRFDGCGIEFVDACNVSGEPYVRAAHQDIHYNPHSDVRSAFAAPPGSLPSFSSSLMSRDITIDYRAAVGVSDVRRSQPSDCEQATHVIAQVTVGAYKAVAADEPPILGGDVGSCRSAVGEAEPPPSSPAGGDSEASAGSPETVADPAESATPQPDIRSALDRMTAAECRIPVTIQLVPIPSGELTTPQCLEGEHVVDGQCVAEKLPKYRIPTGNAETAARFQEVITALEPLTGTARAEKLYALAQLYRGLPPAVVDPDLSLVLGEYVELTTNSSDPHPERREALLLLLDVAVRNADDAATGLASAFLVSEFPRHPESPIAFLELARYYCRKGDAAFAKRTVDSLVYLHGRRKSASKKSADDSGTSAHPVIRNALAEDFDTCPQASK